MPALKCIEGFPVIPATIIKRTLFIYIPINMTSHLYPWPKKSETLSLFDSITSIIDETQYVQIPLKLLDRALHAREGAFPPMR